MVRSRFRRPKVSIVKNAGRALGHTVSDVICVRLSFDSLVYVQDPVEDAGAHRHEEGGGAGVAALEEYFGRVVGYDVDLRWDVRRRS